MLTFHYRALLHLVPNYVQSNDVNKHTGFTLIEVLIAMLVLAIGLLGLAGLQISSLRNTESSYNRSLATDLAYDLADRMRANILGIAAYSNGSAAQIANCENTIGCTPTQMAQNDLYEWNCLVAGGCENNTPAIAGVLPNGLASVSVTAGVYAIMISWDDNHDGIADLSFIIRFKL